MREMENIFQEKGPKQRNRETEITHKNSKIKEWFETLKNRYLDDKIDDERFDRLNNPCKEKIESF